jgi:DNA segregation ATPase FtsK/SpoIIIE, S-DNA-T family
MPSTRSRKPAPKQRASTTTGRSRAQTGAAKRKAPAKKAAAKKGPAPKARARRGGGWRSGLPVLEQHQLDVAGLALIALGILLAFPLWAGGSGGAAGRALDDGLHWLVGLAAVLAPVGLVLCGLLLILRPMLPAVRPFRAGALAVAGAVCLALAAGTFGLSNGPRPDGFASHTVFSQRGGAIGESLYYAAAQLFSSAGAHIIAVFLFIAGVILLTGASIAGLVKSASTNVATTTRQLARDTGTHRARTRAPEAAPTPRRAATKKDGSEVEEWPTTEFAVPEPQDEEDVVVRSTHAEAPSLDGAERYPDIFGDEDAEVRLEPTVVDEPEPDPEPEPVAYEEDVYEEEPEPEVGAQAELPDMPPPVLRARKGPPPEDDPDFHWTLPAASTLKRSTADQVKPDTAGQEKTAAALVEALSHFNVDSKVVGTVAGPHITRYELRLAPGVKMSKVAQLKDDLAYALAATDIRILAPIPGKQAVGIEVPNARRRMVHLGDVFQAAPEGWSPLTVWLGKDVSGKAIGADLAKMPHLLVAGTTGAGKSGAVNAMLSSILLNADPQEVRLVLVDPKQVELNHYEAIPHLLTPVITSPKMAANALQNLVREMEWRYGIMAMARTRSLNELNRWRAEQEEPLARLPYILCVIDELADLMMVAPADVEDSIIRLAQKARAVGIHLVLATQSPRVDVITGMIKANVPSRIAFAVSSQTDSRVILDQNGAESLLGQGDMLFAPVGSSKLQRIQGAYIDEGQIAAITEWWAKQGEPELREDLLDEVESAEPESSGGSDDGFDPDEDPLLGDAIELVVEMGTASTSMLQRRLRLGYTRAGRLIDMLERRGVISGYEGSKPRQVLVTAADLPRVLSALAEKGGPPVPEAPAEDVELPGETAEMPHS